MEKDIILLFGGAGNIAHAITEKYLENNCKVIGLDLLQEHPIKEFNENEDYEYYKVNVTNLEELKNIKETIQNKYGKVTHIISAAGRPMGTEFNGVENLTFEDIESSISLNLISHINITKLFLPLLKNEKENASITYISSINGMKNFDIPAYSAAKAGLYGFMYGIVREFGSYGIRVNTISPGTVPTPVDLEESKEIVEYKKRFAKLSNLATREDIADGVYAITHVMKAMTGQNVVIDAGQVV